MRAGKGRRMESVGKTLKRARKRKGVSLAEAASQTRIQHSILEGLENDNFQVMPSSTYIKGFLKRYAGYLGIDSADLIKSYIATQPKEPEPVLVLKEKKLPRQSFIKPIFIGIAALGIVIVLGGSVLAIRGLIRNRRVRRLEQSSVEKVSLARANKTKLAFLAPARTELPQKAPSPPVKLLPNLAGSLELEIYAQKDVWLVVSCDNSLLFQNVLAAGSQEMWQAKDNLKLWIGNAGALDLRLNNKSLGKLGQEGEVLKEVVITKEGVKINR